jgi:hypothetical protein
VRRSMVTHSRVADGRSASQMPGKIARSTPRPPFGPPVVRVAARSPRLVPGKLENRYYSRQFGSHLENLGYIHPSSLFTYQRGTWTCALV